MELLLRAIKLANARGYPGVVVYSQSVDGLQLGAMCIDKEGSTLTVPRSWNLHSNATDALADLISKLEKKD